MTEAMAAASASAPASGVGVVIEGVTAAFGANVVLKDVSLSVAPGEFFAFLGPSGSGKTTLLRLVAGFGRALAGRVVIGGRDVTDEPPWRRRVGMVFQNYALWPHMTVFKNVAFGLEERRLAKAEIAGRVEEVLELVGLGPLAQRRPAQLSGGQQQRVALARTIVVRPDVLLLDEPLSNLDAQLRVQMRRELLALQRKLGITTIYVTHDQEDANTTADRVAVLEGGRLQQVGRPMELYDRPANRFVATFLGTVNLIEGEIARVGDRVLFRAAGGFDLALREAAANGPACVAIRPQGIRIERAAAGTESAGKKSQGLAGTVVGREFLGGLVRYAVQVGPHRFLVDAMHRRDEPALDPGAGVVLEVAPSEIGIVAG